MLVVKHSKACHMSWTYACIFHLFLIPQMLHTTTVTFTSTMIVAFC